ncbi:MAG: sn-glycerol-3-phosphate ABC transporter ATP-binding protein UgpC [Treponema sp.]|nr:sn-glycerol-3-phosphate ABC transporter ATP-binding protein UgpC [Treponema sp.]
MAKVELTGIGKQYDDAEGFAVENVNITIEDQEFCVFVGPSGCGKSTTLRMIAGLEDISAGDLKIDGVRVNDMPPKDRDIAMVFQNYALYPHMTVYDNMAFGLKIRKMPKEEIDKRVHEAAKQLDLEQYLNRKPKALSGGQRQRVAVGRAIVRNPKVFLFDEPLSNLDAKLRVSMRKEISDLHNRLKATMIYVTHDQVEAMTLANKIVVMSMGHVQQVGKPLDLYNKPINKFVAGFLGTPPMNFMDVTIKEEGGQIVADEGSFVVVPTADQQKKLKEKGCVGKVVTFGIRPEDLHYVETPAAANNMPMIIDNKELLGAEAHLFLHSSKDQNVVARAAQSGAYELGSTCNVVPDMEKAKFFSKDEGELNLVDDIQKTW